MRRLPVFLCVDVSESMIGDAIDSVHNGMNALLQSLRRDPMVNEIGALSIISFGHKAKVEVPLTSVLDVRIPSLDVSSGTSLGAAFEELTRQVDTRVMKTTHEVRGDYKPIVFLITDGQPTDDWEGGLKRFRKANPSVAIHAIGCGDDVDFSLLGRITPHTYSIKNMDEKSFASLFQCVSASVRSVTASMLNGDAVHEDLSEWARGVVQKPTGEELLPHLEPRQILVPAVCSMQKRPYLMRFALQEDGNYRHVKNHPLEHKLEGGESMGATVSTSRLDEFSVPCPYCGNEKFVFCKKFLMWGCNTFSCLSKYATETTCPVCGRHGVIRLSEFDFGTSKG